MMIHVYTKTDGADACWFKGIRCALRHTGGGQLRRSAHGFEVWSRDPERLAHYFNALQALHMFQLLDAKGGA